MEHQHPKTEEPGGQARWGSHSESSAACAEPALLKQPREDAVSSGDRGAWSSMSSPGQRGAEQGGDREAEGLSAESRREGGGGHSKTKDVCMRHRSSRQQQMQKLRMEVAGGNGLMMETRRR